MKVSNLKTNNAGLISAYCIFCNVKLQSDREKSKGWMLAKIIGYTVIFYMQEFRYVFTRKLHLLETYKGNQLCLFTG